MHRLPASARALLLALPLLVSAQRAHAHQYWLTLSDYAPRIGEWVEVGASAGVGFRGEAKVWDPGRCVGFTWITYRPFSLVPMAPEGETLWARQTYFDTLGTWVGYQSNFASIELPAAEFDGYLRDEGLYAPLAARRLLPTPIPGRERYRRCAKAWLPGNAQRRATRPIGQPLELVPLSPPGASSTLRVRVLWKGRPLPGAVVKTWRQPLAENGRTRSNTDRDSVAMIEQRRTNAAGEVVLGVAERGEWLASVVHMVPCADTTAADWESTWASLTFARSERRAAVRR